MRGLKKALILETIIVEYLRSPSPVGSEQLKQRSLGDISSATIRKYFKELLDEGYLTQYHISGGRIPTQQAFEHYWRGQFSQVGHVESCSLELLKECSRVYDISTLVSLVEENILKEVVRVDDTIQLVTSFGTKRMAYDKMIYSFVEQFVGLAVNELHHIAQTLKILPLVDLLSSQQGDDKNGHLFSYLQKDFFSLATNDVAWGNWMVSQAYSGEWEKWEDGVYFDTIVPYGVMAVKMDLTVDNKAAKLVCFGGVSQNFNRFLSTLRSESDTRRTS